MLQPDITELLYDESVGGNQPFDIERVTVTRRKGRYGDPVNEVIHARGSVQPMGENRLEQIPEGDRDGAVIIVRTCTPMQMGAQTDSGAVLSDVILYRGERYKILSVKEWQPWGMYVAYCTRGELSEAEEEAEEGGDTG